MIVLSISSYSFIKFHFIDFEAILLDAYKFIIMILGESFLSLMIAFYLNLFFPIIILGFYVVQNVYGATFSSFFKIYLFFEEEREYMSRREREPQTDSTLSEEPQRGSTLGPQVHDLSKTKSRVLNRLHHPGISCSETFSSSIYKLYLLLGFRYVYSSNLAIS